MLSGTGASLATSQANISSITVLIVLIEYGGDRVENHLHRDRGERQYRRPDHFRQGQLRCRVAPENRARVMSV